MIKLGSTVIVGHRTFVRQHNRLKRLHGPRDGHDRTIDFENRRGYCNPKEMRARSNSTPLQEDDFYDWDETDSDEMDEDFTILLHSTNIFREIWWQNGKPILVYVVSPYYNYRRLTIVKRNDDLVAACA